jgi:hypothetical protein
MPRDGPAQEGEVSEDRAVPYIRETAPLPELPDAVRIVQKAAPGRAPTAAKVELAVWLNDEIPRLAGYKLDGTLSAQRKVDVRNTYVAALCALADEFVWGQRRALECIHHAGLLKGHFNERLSSIDGEKEVVEVEFPGDGRPGWVHLHLQNVQLSAEQDRLYAELQRAATTVNVVYCWKAQRRISRFPFLRRNGSGAQGDNEQSHKRALLRLASIARLAFPDTTSAKTAFVLLTSFREDFVGREAEAVKNDYVAALGRSALIAAAVLFVAYIEIQLPPWPPDIDATQFSPFPVLMAGSCLVAWMSFSVRKTVITFEDLGVLEADRLRPWARLLFVCSLRT